MKWSFGMAGATGRMRRRRNQPPCIRGFFLVQEIDACGSDRINAVGHLRPSWSAYQPWDQLANLCTVLSTAEARLCCPGSNLRRSSAHVRTGTDLRSARPNTRVCAARSCLCPACSNPDPTIIGPITQQERAIPPNQQRQWLRAHRFFAFSSSEIWEPFVPGLPGIFH
jgi:hypothetical protein